MWTRTAAACAASSVLWVWSASAQQRSQAQAPTPTVVDPGVTSMAVIDRPEFRVLRDQCEPGGARRVHQHDNITYHLFILVSGTLQLSIASDPPRDLTPGEVLYLQGGTPHSFTNNGKETATIVEVFGKPQASAAAADAPHGLAAALGPTVK